MKTDNKMNKINIWNVTKIFLCSTLAVVLCSCSYKFDFGGSSQAQSSAKQSSQTEKAPIDTSYCYENITDDSVKALYNQIGEKVQEANLSKIMCEDNLSEKQICEAIEAYKNDHPETFWLKSSYEYYVGESMTTVDLQYTKSGADLVTAKKTFNEKLDSIIDSAPQNASDYELELFANNYIVDNCTYDEEAANEKGIKDSENDAYGALVDGRAVCEGYARAFQLLCNRLNIDCVSITGQANESHQWNCVKLDGDWYQVDVTWNDNEESPWDVNDYFNLTDSQMYKNHTADKLFAEFSNEEYLDDDDLLGNVFVPQCTSDKYNYYKMSCVAVDDIENNSDVVTALAQAAKDNAEYFSFVIDDSLDFDATSQSLMNDGYISSWLDSANAQNWYSPQLNNVCEVYFKDNLNVLTLVLEYN